MSQPFPSVGRVLHYYENIHGKPWAATVAGVSNGSNLVTLSVVHPDTGSVKPRIGVPFYPAMPTEAGPQEQPFCVFPRQAVAASDVLETVKTMQGAIVELADKYESVVKHSDELSAMIAELQADDVAQRSVNEAFIARLTDLENRVGNSPVLTQRQSGYDENYSPSNPINQAVVVEPAEPGNG
jgi:hypothetical protein